MTDDSIIIELGQIKKIPQHVHSGVEIFVSFKGNINLTTDGISYFLRQNDIVLCNSNDVHSAVGVNPNITLRILISEKFLHQEADMRNSYFYCNSCQMSEKERELAYGQLRQMLTQIMLIHYQKKKYTHIDLKCAVLRALSFLYKNFQAEKEKTYLQVSECSDERILSILKYINENYSTTDISLQSVAEKEHLSIHYLSKLFKKRTGIGFLEYIGQLRLARAVNDLLHTDWPIIKIALANGFSNVGSFNKLFLEKYGESPAKYRTTRKIETLQLHSEMEHAFKDESELAKYLTAFNTGQKDLYSENISVQANAKSPPIKRFKVIGRIIRIGRFAELLKTEVREQLCSARNNLKAEYAHFSSLYKDGMYKYKMPAYANYEYFLALDYLYTTGVMPFFSFNVQEFLTENPIPHPDKWGDEIAALLQNMAGHFPDTYTDMWRFEFAYSTIASYEFLWPYYSAFYNAIKKILPKAEIGIQFAENGTFEKNGYTYFTELMARCSSEKKQPEFICYYSEWWKHEEFIENSENYSLYRNYIATLIGNLAQHLLRENGTDMPKVMLMSWNVLSGFTSIESNAFFRSALYADGFVNLDPHITDVAFWLNTYVHEAHYGRDFFEIPSLFLFNNLRRSVSFALTLLDQIYTDVIYQDESVIVTRNEKQDLAILIMNACYFAPKLALDTAYTNSLKRIYSVQLNNIYGEKIIERYHLDNKRTSLYDRWASMGLPPLTNRSVIGQLGKTINLDYALFEEKLEGSYILSVALEFNEMAIINIKNKR